MLQAILGFVAASIVTALYPVVVGLMNIVMITLLVLRRASSSTSMQNDVRNAEAR